MDRHDWRNGQVTDVMLSAAAGIHVGLDAVADLPLAKLRKQLDVNLIAQVSVTQVGGPFLSNMCHIMLSPFHVQKEVTPISWHLKSQSRKLLLCRRFCPCLGQT